MSTIGIEGLIASTTGKNEAKSQGSIKGVKVSTPDIYKSASTKREGKKEGKSLPSKSIQPSGNYKQEISHSKHSPSDLSRENWTKRINRIMYGIESSDYKNRYKSFKPSTGKDHEARRSFKSSGFARPTGYGHRGTQGFSGALKRREEVVDRLIITKEK